MNSHEFMFQFDSALTSKCSFHFFRRFQDLCMRLRLVSPRGFFVLALFDSYYFTQVLRSFLCHRTMWKQVSNLCRTPYVCCLQSDRQDVYIDNVQCQAGPSALIPALTRPVLTFVLVTKPQEKDSLQRCLRMPKDLYCQLDIFLRIFL